MPTKHLSSAVPGPARAFHDAVQLVAAFIRTTKGNEEGTSISSFSDYSGVLERADNGSLEVLTHNDRRYVVLAETQLIALAQALRGLHKVGDLLVDLPRLPATEDRPRVYSINAPNHLHLPT